MLTVQELKDAVEAYKPVAKATQKGWSYGIRGFEEMPVDAIDKRFVVMRRVKLNQKGYKPGYVRTLLGYCGTMWKWAKEMDLVQTNPWEGSLKGLSKDAKQYPFLPFEHYSKLHNDPLFLALWYHGFRVNEIACIQPDEVVTDVPIPYFHIKPNAVRGVKNRPSQRKVPIHPACLSHATQLPFTDDPKAGDYYSRYMKRHVGHSAHGIRHNMATRMRRAGIEYSIAAAILGHTPSGMTAGYGHILLEDMASQLQKLK